MCQAAGEKKDGEMGLPPRGAASTEGIDVELGDGEVPCEPCEAEKEAERARRRVSATSAESSSSVRGQSGQSGGWFCFRRTATRKPDTFTTINGVHIKVSVYLSVSGEPRDDIYIFTYIYIYKYMRRGSRTPSPPSTGCTSR